MADAVEFVDLVKTYPTGPLGRGGVAAVRGVTLAVPAGRVVGLVGPNRAGKTTLAKMLLSLCRPTAGRVFRLGAPAADRSTLARVGYMHENHAFPRYLSAAEMLRLYAGLSGVPPAAAEKRLPGLLDRVGLADRADDRIGRYSKGMVQRLGLAQALVNDPDLLVLDEPAEGLDIPARQLVREVVREHRAAGKTVVLISHAAAEVEAVCDDLVVLVAGRVRFRGPPADLAAGHPSLEAALRAAYEAPEPPPAAVPG